MKSWLPVFLFCALAWPAQAAGVSIAPHRAVYKMSLFSAKNGSHVRNVTGQIEYEWADTCDAWATQQHMTLRFTDMEGEEREIVSHVLATESKDGKNYQFNIRRFVDGQEDDSYKGEAELMGRKGRAVYALPKEWGDKVLPEGTLFPTTHTLLIIQKAQSGEKLFSRPVFDGSDEGGVVEVSAFIGAGDETKAMEEMKAELKAQALLSGKAWPVRLAFFPTKEGTGLPDYEMDMVLQPNGIARAMHIDYGDFVVGGALESIEALKPTVCPEHAP